MNRATARLLPLAGLSVLLLTAGVVAATAPTAAQWEQPFAVHAAMGERATGRNISATIHAVTRADHVVDDRWSSTPGSTWVIVEASVAVLRSETAAIMGRAALIVGDRTYVASTRPSVFTLTGVALSVDIPTRGLLVFELPDDNLDEAGAVDARLELAINADPRLDSTIVSTIDLTEVPARAEVELNDAEWGAR